VKSQLNFDDAVNDWSLIELTATDYDKLFIGQEETGSPTHYYPLGVNGVEAQPASSGVISVVSDSTSDTATSYITVIGYTSTNLLIREKVTLTGTVAASTTNSFATIERLVKTTDDGTSFVGNITVTDSSANTLAIIPVWVGSPSYAWVEFYPIPDASLTYTLRAMAYKPDLVEDDDWPDIDENFHDLLLYGPGMEVLPSFGQENIAQLYGGLFQKRWKEFQTMIDPKPNLVQTFADVSMGSRMPIEPYIKGVHYGLAVGQ
jgi:hypothetical protein